MLKFSLLFFVFCITTFAHAEQNTKTPIQHLVVIFQENRPFDHYFGTYPEAENKKGEMPFFARSHTPRINGLTRALLQQNQNLVNPFRLSPRQASTTNNPKHTYTILQQNLHAGLVDQFVQHSGTSCNPPTIVMGYFDGNTVTAMWNYAQHFAMSDNFHSTCVAASTVGAINLISGQTHGAIPATLTVASVPIVVDQTLINDIDPKYDMCSATSATVELTGINIGNLLNKKKVTWGWFQGGFRNCKKTHEGPIGEVLDYVPHHNPFQYYKSTSNPNHLKPSSVNKIGKTDRANHLYDLTDFWKAIDHGNIPAVSFLKARAFQNGHGGNSDPFLEQEFLVSTINRLQKLPEWKSMAIIIAYDDAGGWYDHEMPPIINQSQTSADALLAPGNAGSNTPSCSYQGRLAYGQRLPFLLISPWAKENYIDHKMIDQTSILRFIEDNWDLGKIGDCSFDSLAGSIEHMFNFHKKHVPYLLLDKRTGQVKEKGCRS